MLVFTVLIFKIILPPLRCTLPKLVALRPMTAVSLVSCRNVGVNNGDLGKASHLILLVFVLAVSLQICMVLYGIEILLNTFSLTPVVSRYDRNRVTIIITKFYSIGYYPKEGLRNSFRDKTPLAVRSCFWKNSWRRGAKVLVVLEDLYENQKSRRGMRTTFYGSKRTLAGNESKVLGTAVKNYSTQGKLANINWLGTYNCLIYHSS